MNPREGYSPQMASLRSVGRTLGGLVTTLVIGGLVGFVAMTLITPFLPGPVQPGDRHEPKLTRDYMLALLRRDASVVNQLELPKNPAMRAMTWKRLEQADQLEHHTLTYLGGAATERIGAQVYVLGARQGDSYFLVPFEVTTLGDKVYYLRGGSLGGAIPIAPAPSPAASASGDPG
jgi:hypothetical protein